MEYRIFNVAEWEKKIKSFNGDVFFLEYLNKRNPSFYFMLAVVELIDTPNCEFGFCGIIPRQSTQFINKMIHTANGKMVMCWVENKSKG